MERDVKRLQIRARFTATSVLVLGVAVGCGSRMSTIGTPLRGTPPTVSYSCGSTLALRVRIDATSATITADGEGPFTLPQSSGRSDFTVFSDGARVLQIYRGETSYGLVGRVLQPCTPA